MTTPGVAHECCPLPAQLVEHAHHVGHVVRHLERPVDLGRRDPALLVRRDGVPVGELVGQWLEVLDAEPGAAVKQENPVAGAAQGALEVDALGIDDEGVAHGALVASVRAIRIIGHCSGSRP